MNREKMIKKDIANKQAQARDEYAKNKPLYSQEKLKAKAEYFADSNKKDTENKETEEQSREEKDNLK
ncbi:MAG TPA: hypothetical protein DIT04_05540 [Dysgonomonas sp.]|nr:hypothetical protein [Dysgonomonas sp.]